MRITYTISGVQSTQGGDVPAILDTDSADFQDRLHWVIQKAGVGAYDLIAGHSLGPDADGKLNTPLDTVTVVFVSEKDSSLRLAIDAVYVLRETANVAATLAMEFGTAIDGEHLRYDPPAPASGLSPVNPDVNRPGSPIGERIPTADARRFKVAPGNRVAEGAGFFGVAGHYIAVRRGLGFVSQIFWELQ